MSALVVFDPALAEPTADRSVASTVKETAHPKLPEGWKVKNINGVEYFKTEDEDGLVFVFHNRRQVVEFLRQNNSKMTEEELVDFLEEGDPESELSEYEENEENLCSTELDLN